MIPLARRLVRALASVLGGVVALYLCLGVGLRLVEGRLVFHPPDDRWEACALPSGVTRVAFGGERGVLTEASHDALLIFYHGNAQSACNWRYLGPNHVAPLGYDALVVEYPGYGGDVRGRGPSSATILAAVAEAHQWARARYARIAVMGYSIGTGPAAAHAALGGVETAMLIAPYRSLYDLMWSKGYLYPRWWAVNRFDNASALAMAQVPVAILAGAEDRVIPPEQTEALAAHLRSRGVPVAMSVVSGAGHAGVLDGPAFDRFLAGALGQP